MKFMIILTVVFICSICNSKEENNSTRRINKNLPKYRLPNNVLPVKYNLEVVTTLDKSVFNFYGNVSIKIHCLKESNTITLHSKQLNISTKDVELWCMKDDKPFFTIAVLKHEFDEENDFYKLTIGQKLVKDHYYVLNIPFAAALEKGLAGFYRSSYVDKATGNTKWLAITHFEPTDARRAFPCFDEPAIKAVFSISIGHAKKYKAISNMPLMDIGVVKSKRSWMLETFEDTKPMSTYLVAYMVSELDHRISNLNYSPGVVCRVWARKDVVEQVEFAREITPKILVSFEKYFDTEYPLPKQDLVAIPDFSSGAMENWGLITFRERALLYDSNQSSIFDKHIVASVLSHELAHQWFGNLVTMNWWTDLWLNEGFATYVGSLGVNHLFPEWKTLDSEIVDNLLLVFALDSLNSTHPVSVPIGHPREINQIFDIISYKKGCIILHMMHHFLTPEVFQRGVKQYLKQHRYSNATQDDLWSAMTDAAHAKPVLPLSDTVKMIMDSWTLESGYPLLTVRRHYANQTATIIQERYLSSKFRLSYEKLYKSCWVVPLTYTTSAELDFESTKPKKWLSCGGPFIILSLPPKNHWIVFNIRATALYRVNYDDENWRLLSATLANRTEYTKIAALNRVLLISDLFALGWIKRITYKFLFDTLRYLKHESEYLPWKTAFHGFEQLRSMLIHSPVYSKYKQYVTRLIEPIYTQLGGNISKVPNDYEGLKFHSMVKKFACYYNISNCRNQTVQLFHSWYIQPNSSDNNPIPKNLRREVYCNALRYSEREDYWMFLWEQYGRSGVVSEKNIILAALACTENKQTLKRYLKWSLEKSKIRKQDTLIVFHHVANNEIGFEIAEEFFRNNFERIWKLHILRRSNLGHYIKVLATQITTKEHLDQFEEFIISNSDKLKEASMAIQQGMETAKNNINWHSVHSKKLSLYFVPTRVE